MFAVIKSWLILKNAHVSVTWGLFDYFLPVEIVKPTELIIQSLNNKADSGNEKTDDLATGAEEEDVESSGAESDEEEAELEINPNIAKVAVGASYESFKDFQVSYIFSSLISLDLFSFSWIIKAKYIKGPWNHTRRPKYISYREGKYE